jgi:hypothetical protein
MTEMDSWLRAALGLLATWRATHLLVNEDGPGNLLVRLRRLAGKGWPGGLMNCFYCASLWVAVPAALWVGTRPLEIAASWLALSGGACLLERLGGRPVIVETWKGDQYDMLRRGAEEDRDAANIDYAALG